MAGNGDPFTGSEVTGSLRFGVVALVPALRLLVKRSREAHSAPRSWPGPLPAREEPSVWGKAGGTQDRSVLGFSRSLGPVCSLQGGLHKASHVPPERPWLPRRPGPEDVPRSRWRGSQPSPPGWGPGAARAPRRRGPYRTRVPSCLSRLPSGNPPSPTLLRSKRFSWGSAQAPAYSRHEPAPPTPTPALKAQSGALLLHRKERKSGFEGAVGGPSVKKSPHPLRLQLWSSFLKLYLGPALCSVSGDLGAKNYLEKPI